MFGRLYDDVYNLIKEWKPARTYSKESGYRDDLLGYLRKELNRPSTFGFTREVAVRKEASRSLADIAVDRAIGIEVKKDLRGMGEVDRTASQVRRHSKEYTSVLIVLVGNTREDMIVELRDHLRGISRETGNLLLSERRIEIIVKEENMEEDGPRPFTFGI